MVQIHFTDEGWERSRLFCINFFVLFADGEKRNRGTLRRTTLVHRSLKSHNPLPFMLFAESSMRPCQIDWSTRTLLRPLSRLRARAECWTTTPTRPPRPLVSVHPPSAREIPTTRRRTRPRSGRKSPKAHRRPQGSALTRLTGTSTSTFHSKTGLHSCTNWNTHIPWLRR